MRSCTSFTRATTPLHEANAQFALCLESACLTGTGTYTLAEGKESYEQRADHWRYAQDWSYLAELLLTKGYELHAIIRRASTSIIGRIDQRCQDL